MPRAIFAVLGLLALLPATAWAEAASARVPLPPAHVDPATRQISVVVDRGLRRTIDLPTEELRQARIAYLADLPIGDAQLRALADHRDGRAAQDYVRRLLAADPRGSDSDIAYYASIAVATGRVWTLPDAVDAMRRLDPATEPADRVRRYSDMLYPHAWAGNTLALHALIDLNGEGRLFGALSSATRARILDAGRRAGDATVPLHLALAALGSPAPSAAALARAREDLSLALATDDPAVQAVAATFLARLDAGTP